MTTPPLMFSLISVAVGTAIIGGALGNPFLGFGLYTTLIPFTIFAHLAVSKED